MESLSPSGPPDAPALVDGERVISHAELDALIGANRSALAALGLEDGARVAIIATTCPETVIAIAAVIEAGYVAVPLNPSSPVAELRKEIDEVGASLALTARPVADDLGCPVAAVIGAQGDPAEPLAEGAPIGPRPADPGQVALMLFTSGTAGLPKAAMISHGNIDFITTLLVEHPDTIFGPDGVVLACLPLSHVYGLAAVLFPALRSGTRLVLQDRFDAAESIGLIRDHQVTFMAGVPPMWRAMLDVPGASADDLASLQRVASGASALPRRLFDEFEERFGIELNEGYGLTETTSIVSGGLGHTVKAGSVGKPFEGIEVAVVDHYGVPVPPDDAGDVLVRGPNVFLGYWGNAEATKAVLDDDGWLHTGDIGVFTEDGYLHLVDRAKDLIIVSGFNVYPFEVETVVNRHPSVDESIVVGREDPRRGERVVAYVTLLPGAEAPSVEDMTDHCRALLARYKCPSELHVVDELPIAPTGKRIRRELA